MGRKEIGWRDQTEVRSGREDTFRKRSHHQEKERNKRTDDKKKIFREKIKRGEGRKSKTTVLVGCQVYVCLLFVKLQTDNSHILHIHSNNLSV